MSIGENIKSRRKDVGMSQNELASAIGVSVPMICQIERGTKIPSMLLGKSIAQVFGCKIDELYGGE